MGWEDRRYTLESMFYEHHKAVREQEARDKLNRVKYTIGIVGMGNVGQAIAEKILILNKDLCLSKAYNHLGIDRIILSTQDREKGEAAVDEIKNVGITHGQTEIAVETVDSGHLGSIARETDIFIICAADPNEGREGNERSSFLKYNQPIIKSIAEQFPPDYKSTVVIITNPCDLTAYLFAAYSSINPRRIVGMNHVGTLRLRNKLVKRFRKYSNISNLKDIDAWVIGEHGPGMWPVVSTASINNIELPQKIREEWPEIQKEARAEGLRVLKNLGSTRISTSLAVSDIIRAIMTETEPVECSTYFEFYKDIDGIFGSVDFELMKKKGLVPKKGLFIGYPVFFNQGIAQPVPKWDFAQFRMEEKDRWKEWFKKLDPTDKEMFFKNARNLEENIGEIDRKETLPALTEVVLPEKKTFAYKTPLRATIFALEDTLGERRPSLYAFNASDSRRIFEIPPEENHTLRQIFSRGKDIVILGHTLVRDPVKGRVENSLIKWYSYSHAAGVKPVKSFSINNDVSGVQLAGKKMYASCADNSSIGVVAMDTLSQKTSYYKTDKDDSIGSLLVLEPEQNPFRKTCVLGGADGGIYLWLEGEENIEKGMHFTNASGNLHGIKRAGNVILAGSRENVYLWGFHTAGMEPVSFRSNHGLFDVAEEEGNILLAYVVPGDNSRKICVYSFASEDALLSNRGELWASEETSEDITYLSFAGKNSLLFVKSGSQNRLCTLDLLMQSGSKGIDLDNADISKLYVGDEL